MSTIKAGTTSTTAYQVEADTTGDLVIATGASANVAMTVNSSGNIGIGTSSPTYKFHVAGTGGYVARFDRTATTSGLDIGADSSGAILQPFGVDAIQFYNAAGTTRNMLLNASGNLGLGVTPSAWDTSTNIRAMQLGGGSVYSYNNDRLFIGQNVYIKATTTDAYVGTGKASSYRQYDGTHAWYTAPSGTAGNTITFTQAMTLDASGNLGVGQTSPATPLDITKNGTQVGTTTAYIVSHSRDATPNKGIALGYDSASQTGIVLSDSNSASSNLAFWTYDSSGSGWAERARITAAGEWLVGQTAGSINATGAYITGAGQGGFCVSGSTCILVNRKASDGTLVSFRQDDNEEGTISVSGATVSYNAFAGSHWSQLQDGSKPDILRGTVMESINELCVWPDETNERLPKSKISDTAGSKKVYGVFMAWDNDWTETNDMYVTAVGAFICRVNASVTVQEGDLLESNGDGTARVQADDIIRSSTIGKVTSTVKTHEYDDGSYCVPTVLYCG